MSHKSDANHAWATKPIRKQDPVVTLTLLVVDDQLSLRRLLEVVAGEDDRYGRVVSASRTAEAVRLAGEHQPDAVLLDVGLGEEDGLASVDDLRAAAPATVIVVFSSTPYADVETVRRAGADLFVPKGTDPDLLLDLIAQQVAARATPRTHVDLSAAELRGGRP
jgi:DNA-binding NarL/FixJ family response regulator